MPTKNILTNACLRSWPILLLALFLSMFTESLQAQSKYVKKYRHLADSLSKEYEIPAAIILGVAIMESGSGTSRNAKLLNNHFGITGKNNLLKTKGIKSRYKQYQNVADSYIDFCKLISRRRFYATLKGNTDYRLWVEAIAKTGYSEVPVEWKKRVIAVIRRNKLSTVHQ